MSKSRNIDIERVAHMLSALSNPHRLELFVRLTSCCAPGTTCDITDKSSVCVGELGDGLGIAPSTVSHHLKELRNAGIIRMERCGQRVECWIDAEVVKDLAQFFTQQLEDSPGAPALNCCQKTAENQEDRNDSK